ncbi:MAG: 3'-5' exonuclease [Cyanobacteria bacterium P01_A01_bin.123]
MPNTPFDQFAYYLVVDLEATCCDQKQIPRKQMEIIEIGAVMVASIHLAVVDEFQMFVKPVRHPILTEFCTQLTTITQAEVNQAPGFKEAIAAFSDWLTGYENCLFCSWGDFDRNQFKQDCKFHAVPFPVQNHFNLKKAFLRTQGLKQRRGMAQALELAGIPLVGTHHRGIDDARNIAKLLPHGLGRKRLQRSEMG